MADKGDEIVAFKVMRRDHFTAARKFVFVDIPDPDNFLMVLEILRDFPYDPVVVVLAPRPLCFSALRYGSEFRDVFKAVQDTFAGEELQKLKRDEEAYKDDKKIRLRGVKEKLDAITERRTKINSETLSKMLTTIRTKEEWISRLPRQTQPWFYIDEDARQDPTIQADTRLYMKVSTMRLVGFLSDHGIPLDRYRIYWDEESMQHIDVPMRHAIHNEDFTYGFNDVEKDQYQAATDRIRQEPEHGGLSTALGDDVRGICESYVSRMSEQLKVGPDKILKDFNTLISEMKGQAPVDILVGGPFTETLKYLRSGCQVKQITGMGGFLHGNTNIFPNQFNFHLDLESAAQFLQEVREGTYGVKLMLLPTECAKGSVFALKKKDIDTFVEDPPATTNLIKSYYQGIVEEKEYPMFDWITAITAKMPDLLTWKPADFNIEKTEAGKVKRITFTLGAGNFGMYVDDEAHMIEMREAMLETMVKTLGAKG